MKDQKDIRPTILLTIKGLLIKDSLVDRGIRIGPTFNVILSKTRNPICQESSTKVNIIDKGLVSHLGAIEDVVIQCFGISISMDLYVVLLKGSSYALVLITLDARIKCNIGLEYHELITIEGVVSLTSNQMYIG